MSDGLHFPSALPCATLSSRSSHPVLRCQALFTNQICLLFLALGHHHSWAPSQFIKRVSPSHCPQPSRHPSSAFQKTSTFHLQLSWFCIRSFSFIKCLFLPSLSKTSSYKPGSSSTSSVGLGLIFLSLYFWHLLHSPWYWIKHFIRKFRRWKFWVGCLCGGLLFWFLNFFFFPLWSPLLV